MQGKITANGRRPANTYEAEFFDQAAAKGWRLTKRGWPDFFLERDGKIVCVEVKPSSSRELKGDQRRVCQALATAGIPIFVWSPDGGLQRVAVGVRGLEVEDDVRTLDELWSSLSEKAKGCGGSGGSGDEATPTAPAAPPEAAPSLPSGDETSQMIDRVWATYVAVMKPRRTAAGGDERLFIRNALKVATPEELILCVKTCEESDYHMKRGEHFQRHGGRYNALGKILKPRPKLGETQRSRIDWWLDRANSSGVAGFPSADAAIISQRQVEVQRGHRSDDPETVRKAKDAEAWLAEHGIETVRRRSDLYPTFRRLAGDE